MNKIQLSYKIIFKKQADIGAFDNGKYLITMYTFTASTESFG